MIDYKEKYLKYKTKYLMLKNKMTGGFLNPNDELTADERKEILDNIGIKLYTTLLNLIESGKIVVSVLKTYLAEYKTQNFFDKERLKKYIILIENGIGDSYYAYEFSKTEYTIDEILKYKDFPPNFILNILGFTKEQKDRLNRLLTIQIPPVLAYHIVNNNKSIEDEATILELFKKNKMKEAIKLAREQSSN